jgi:hypothetical protein
MPAMISQSLVDTERVARFADLQAALVEYASHIGELRTPDEVLDALHAIIRANDLCNELGMDTITAAATLSAWGETRPLSASKAQNRRVEVIIEN